MKAIGDSPEFLTVMRAARMVAVTDATALILGESGSGKELLARAIHKNSRRNTRPFVAINCAALPETLAEAELFGYKKGAFTGATRNEDGKIRAANGGTLFLDEIGELVIPVQAKLLRFMEQGEIQPVGESAPVKVDTRIVAATNCNLREKVREGSFREDLYYRLCVVPLTLPPLRERGRDVETLLKHFTAEFADKYGLRQPMFGKSAMTALLAYRWPGNVRELKNFCERMVILCQGVTLEEENLPAEIRFATHAGDFAVTDFQLPDPGINFHDLEASIIWKALQKTNGNKSRAAKLLGLTRDTLLYRIKKYAIQF